MENPGETLERVRKQLRGGQDTEERPVGHGDVDELLLAVARKPKPLLRHLRPSTAALLRVRPPGSPTATDDHCPRFRRTLPLGRPGSMAGDGDRGEPA